MNRSIREGRWAQVRGRVKRAWGGLIGDDRLEAEGNAEVVAGALEESIGIAKRGAAREVTRGVDAVAALAKKAARTLES
jgi:uncharacterized protein YjbJ (UPF0337 family)